MADGDQIIAPDMSQTVQELLVNLQAAIEPFKNCNRIVEWNESCIQLVDAIGMIFRHGLRKGIRAMIFSSNTSFWQFVREFSAPDTIERVKEIGRKVSLLAEREGRENAWIICSLNYGDLGSYLALLSRNRKLVKAFYSEDEGAFLLQREALNDFDETLRELEGVKFELNLESYAKYLTKPKAEHSLPEPQTLLYSPALVMTDSNIINKSDRNTLEKEGGKGEESIEHLPSISEITEKDKIEKLLTREQSREDIRGEAFDTIERSSAEETAKTSRRNNRNELHDNESVSSNAVQKSELTKSVSSTVELQGSPIVKDVIAGKFIPADGAPRDNLRDKVAFVIPDERESLFQTIAQEIPPSPVSFKREELYSLENIDRESIIQGQEEIQNIVAHPRLPPVQVVEQINSGKNTHSPVLINTPTRDETRKGFIDSPFSDANEFGFFGIPLNIDQLYNVVHPFGCLLVYIIRIINFLTLQMLIEDESEEESSPDPSIFLNYETLFKSSNASMKKSCKDNFQFELNICPATSRMSVKCFKCGSSFNATKTRMLCDVTGEYFCLDCFGNMLIPVPARILREWDLDPRPVNKDTAEEYLLHFGTALLNVKEVAPDLFNRAPCIGKVGELQSRIIKKLDHVKKCPKGVYATYRDQFKGRGHLVERPFLYTIQDLININNGSLLEFLKTNSLKLDEHITFECIACHRLTRCCQVCKSPETIYSSDNDTNKCPNCGMLFHQACWAKLGLCPSCSKANMDMCSSCATQTPLSSFIDYTLD